MTVGEFSRKHGVGYQTVRAATFRTATRQNTSWALDFDEAELKRAVREELAARRAYHQGILDKIDAEARSLERKEGTPDE